MSEFEQGALAGALAGGAGGAGAQGGEPPKTDEQQQQQQQQQQAAAFPAWFGEVPPELQTDDLKTRAARYETPLDMFKSLTETQDWARGRVALPKEGDPQSYAEFVAKIRPEKMEDYKIAVPDGQSPEFAESFRAFAFENGGEPQFVEKLSGWWNQAQADMASKQQQTGTTELKAIEMEMGEAAYVQRLEAVQNMLGATGIDAADIGPALEKIGGGAGKAMQALFKLAESTGELGKVDGSTVSMRLGTMSREAAQAEVDRYGQDRALFDKAKVKGSPEWQRLKDLNAIIAGV